MYYIARISASFYALIVCSVARSTEYLYPVAKIPSFSSATSSENGAMIGVIYQKQPSHIEWWLWNPQSGCLRQALLSRFTPGMVRLLPDERSFSFVDNGMIMIKDFMKRSPTIVELSHPLYNVSMLYWINNQICYLSAKKRDRYGIFLINRLGMTLPLLWDNVRDYVYPQIVGDRVFCVTRSLIPRCQELGEEESGLSGELIRYSIVEIPIKEKKSLIDSLTFLAENSDIPGDMEEENNDRNDPKRDFGALLNKTIILTENVDPIVFLNMISDTEGFYISHPIKISQKDVFLELSYHHIRFLDQQWIKKTLFSFSVPINLLFDGPDRLYESIFPLLPRHSDDCIIFSSTCTVSDGFGANLFSYHVPTGIVSQLTHAEHNQEHYFSPLMLNATTMICGGPLKKYASSDNDDGKVCSMWCGDDGEVYAQFPVFDISNVVD